MFLWPDFVHIWCHTSLFSHFSLKYISAIGRDDPKIKMYSSFTHPQVFPNLFWVSFFCLSQKNSVQQKKETSTSLNDAIIFIFAWTIHLSVLWFTVIYFLGYSQVSLNRLASSINICLEMPTWCMSHKWSAERKKKNQCKKKIPARSILDAFKPVKRKKTFFDKSE